MLCFFVCDFILLTAVDLRDMIVYRTAVSRYFGISLWREYLPSVWAPHQRGAKTAVLCIHGITYTYVHTKNVKYTWYSVLGTKDPII